MPAPTRMIRMTESLSIEFLDSFFGPLPVDLEASDEGETVELTEADLTWLAEQQKGRRA